MQSVPLFQVDAFTDKPFSGNPAAVCLLSAPAEKVWMQQVADEMNLSETAFLARRESGSYDLRWFTPTTEVDLCGHATLASAHVLWSEGLEDRRSTLRFATLSGTLKAKLEEEIILLDFPAEPPEPEILPAELLKALGIEQSTYQGKNRMDCLIEVEREHTLRQIQPDYQMLARFSARGVIVTSRSNSPEYDFVSRFFAPAFGIDEDPVTGSAHCCLSPYWSQKLGKDSLWGYQASRRGGRVGVRWNGDRVYLRGSAVTVFRAEMA